VTAGGLGWTSAWLALPPQTAAGTASPKLPTAACPHVLRPPCWHSVLLWRAAQHTDTTKGSTDNTHVCRDTPTMPVRAASC
jgi:hypothetical protein